MDPRLSPLVSSLELHTRLLVNCFHDVPDELALERPSNRTNNMTFLAAHLTDARRYMAGLLGAEVDNPFPELEDGQGIDDFEELPAVAEILEAWQRLGAVVRKRMEDATPEILDAETEQDFPVDDPTLLGALAFLTSHESYHIGQVAYLRKLAGLEAMAYESE